MYSVNLRSQMHKVTPLVNLHNQMRKATLLAKPASLARNRTPLEPRAERTTTQVPSELLQAPATLRQRILLEPRAVLIRSAPTTVPRTMLEQIHSDSLRSLHNNLPKEIRLLANRQTQPLQHHPTHSAPPTQHRPQPQITPLASLRSRSLMDLHHRTINSSQTIRLGNLHNLHSKRIPLVNLLMLHPPLPILLPQDSHSNQLQQLQEAHTHQTAVDSILPLKATAPRESMVDYLCSRANQLFTRMASLEFKNLTELGNEFGSQTAHRDILRTLSYRLRNTTTSPKLNGCHLPRRVTLKAA